MNKFLIVFFFLFFVSGLVLASSPNNEELRKINREQLEKYQSDKDFKYLESSQKGPGLQDKILGFFMRILQKIFSNKAAFYIASNLHYLVLIVAIIVFVLTFSRVRISKIFKKDISLSPDSMIFSEDSIENIDFALLAEQSILKKNYKNAIRYQYLLLLQILNQKELIKYQPYKTNYDYHYEINDDTIRELFNNIFSKVEHVWYGGFTIDEKSFSKQQIEVDTLMKRIN